MEIFDKQGKRLIEVSYMPLCPYFCGEIHRHADLEMSCVVQGRGTYQIGEGCYSMRRGDVFLLPPADAHGIRLSEEGLDNLVIHFSPSFLWSPGQSDLDYNFLLIFFERGPHFSHRLDRDNPVTARVFSLMLEILDEMERQDLYYELIVKNKLQQILTEILRGFDYIDRKKARSPVSRQGVEQLDAVMQFIDEHWNEDLRLETLARVARVSPVYFSVLFKRFNGLSPMEYIIRRRVLRAGELLRTTDLPLAVLAADCGFHNSANFYKAFKRVTGKTPLAYRKGAADDAAT